MNFFHGPGGPLKNSLYSAGIARLKICALFTGSGLCRPLSDTNKEKKNKNTYKIITFYTCSMCLWTL